jgi:tetratricopeptide (TPR) repeat protein
MKHRKGSRPGKLSTGPEKIVDLLQEGLKAHNAGDLMAATRYYESALSIAPRNPDALHLLGVAVSDRGQPEQGIQSIQRAIRERPNTPMFYISLGDILQQQGQIHDALANYDIAISIRPDLDIANNNRGNALRKIGLNNEAIASFSDAIALNSSYFVAFNNRGLAFLAGDQPSLALDDFDRAIALSPTYSAAHSNRCVALRKLGRFAEALQSIKHAVSLQPNSSDFLINLANTHLDLGQIDDALATYDLAIELKPGSAEVYNNMGNALRSFNRLTEAIEALRRAIEIRPDYADAQWNLGLAYLSVGRFQEGWKLYEARYSDGMDRRIVSIPTLDFPRWKGEQLRDKSLLIYPEQGYGDYIQFIRYSAVLKDQGLKRLSVVCSKPLVPLLKTARGVDEVLTLDQSLPRHDFWSFPLSLPLHFKTEMDSIPAEIPYLNPESSRIEFWRNRFPKTTKRLVGLVWKGDAIHKNDRHRSLPDLRTLRQLWSIPGIVFVSLQKGSGENEAISPPPEQPIINLGSEIGDFGDSAAIISQLDLVISVDTAIVHVAGALGKKCWVLLPVIGSDWRWLADRGDSPWYPNALRLFRQAKGTTWTDTIELVAHELGIWAKTLHARSMVAGGLPEKS